MPIINCRGFRCFACLSEGNRWDDDDDVGEGRHLHLSVYFLSSDAGSDQNGAGGMIERDVAGKLRSWVFRQFCLLHQNALIVKRQLAALHPYWGQLAKLVNLWRTCVSIQRNLTSIVTDLVCGKSAPGGRGRASQHPKQDSTTLSWFRVCFKLQLGIILAGSQREPCVL
jgi:hypothetical protein